MQKPKKEKEEKKIILCYICGDTGMVPRMYLEPGLGGGADARQKVPCPKCLKREGK